MLLSFDNMKMPPHVVAVKSCVSHWYACLPIELLCLTIVVGIDGMEVGAEMERKPKTKHHKITQTVPIIANISVILNIIEEGKHIQIIRRQISSGD